jgi:DNA-binding PadR family transcriptional regulator
MASHADVVILGLLVEAPQYGYEIMQRVEKMNLRQWARVGNATIYSVLARLEREGALSVSSRQTGARPARNVFAITELGRARLREGVAELLSSAQSVYSDRVVGLAFSWALPPGVAMRAMREALDATERALTGLRKTRTAAARTSRMSGVILDFYIRVLTAERRAVEAVLATPATAPAVRARRHARRLSAGSKRRVA